MASTIRDRPGSDFCCGASMYVHFGLKTVVQHDRTGRICGNRLVIAKCTINSFSVRLMVEHADEMCIGTSSCSGRCASHFHGNSYRLFFDGF